MENRLVRRESDKRLAGVCAGLARYLGIDPAFVRLAFVLLTLASGVGLLLYVALAVIMPSEEKAGMPVSWEHNLEDATRSVSDSLDEARNGDNGPRLLAGLLITVGVFFLLQNLGWSIGLSVVGPLLLVALGAWLLIKRGQQS